MSTDHITELKKLVKQATDDEIAFLRAENKALRAALAKAEQAIIDTAVATVNQTIAFDDINRTATVVPE